jgi:hypothetical protein
VEPLAETGRGRHREAMAEVERAYLARRVGATRHRRAGEPLVERVDDRREVMIQMGVVASDHVRDGALPGAPVQPIHLHQPVPDFRTSGVRAATVGHSGPKEPVRISPAGSYVPITTPVVDTFESTSFSPDGIVPSANRRLPEPMTTGKTQRR